MRYVIMPGSKMHHQDIADDISMGKLLTKTHYTKG